uniref:SH3 domain-containing protein n=1 Tax=Acrobeloides nanus TaxID=290746 RepID=A0A914CVN1_9BILA
MLIKAIAKYNFIGRNNDELSFSKNDVIIIIQQLDGGWWEGSFNDKIGWFPSNFVDIVNEKTLDVNKRLNLSNGDGNASLNSNSTTYRNQVLEEYLKNESQHIEELQHVLTGILFSVKNAQILSEEEFIVLNSNLSDVTKFKKNLLNEIEKSCSQSVSLQRIGEIFLVAAPELKLLMKTYCEKHPMVMDIINKKKNLMVKILSSHQKDLKELIAGLKNSLNDESIIDRCLILFDYYILLLEVLLDKGSYALRDKFGTSDLSILKNDENYSIVCHKGSTAILKVNALTNEDYIQMISSINACTHIAKDDNYSLQTISPTSPQKFELENFTKIDDFSPIKKPQISELPQSHQGIDEDKPEIYQQAIESNNYRSNKLWMGNCLRSIPASRGTMLEDFKNFKIKMRKGVLNDEQEDAYLMKIIEGYYGSTNLNISTVRTGVTSNIPKSHTNNDDMRPQLIVADEEKIFVEEIEGDEVVVKEKSLVDTVYSLKDQLGAVQKELILIAKTLDKEQKARRRLEELLRRSSQQYSLSSTPKPISESLDDNLQ